MNKDYTQPFFIPYDKRHLFRGISHSGYLPALEQKEVPEPPKVIYKPHPVDDDIDQLKAGFLYLQKQLNERRDKARRKGKY